MHTLIHYTALSTLLCIDFLGFNVTNHLTVNICVCWWAQPTPEQRSISISLRT